MTRYTVTVRNITQGWSLTAVHGMAADPDVQVVLGTPLTYTWGFADQLIPGQLDPFAASVTVLAVDATHIPETQVGDLVTIDVRLGTTGPRVTAPYPMRVTDPVVDLTGPDDRFRATLSMSLVDASADWTGLEPVGYVPRFFSTLGGWDNEWRNRIAALGRLIGFSIGCPTTWDDTDQPAGSFKLAPLANQTFSGTAKDNTEALLNSHQPGSLTHTWVTCQTGSHPTGYKFIGDPGSSPDQPDPAGPVHIEAVPASRRLAPTAGLPLQLATVAGRIVTRARQAASTAAGAMTQLGVSAGWCDLPTQARRSRAALVNTVVLSGQGVVRNTQDDGSYDYDFVDQPYTASDGLAVGARGPITRGVSTQLYTGPIGYTDPTYGPPAVEPAAVAALFIADGSVVDAPWAYDTVSLAASRLPDDVATWMLPRLVPRLPGETDGDGRLVRHVTIYNLDPDLAFNGQPAAGFVTGGTLTIDGAARGADGIRGDILFALSLAPGRPQWTAAAPAPITVAQFTTAFGTLLPAAAAPVQVGDLAYVNPPEA